MKPAADVLLRHVLHRIQNTDHRMRPNALIRDLVSGHGVTRREACRAIQRLVDGGQLAYTQEFGSCFLVPAINAPVRITDRVVLKPAAHPYRGPDHEVVISLRHGAAFGCGDHPSTRMALRMLDSAALPATGNVSAGCQRGLDVGTGSGVLIIAAVALGCRQGIGVDIDPCAVFEARENVRLNGLQERIEIRSGTLDTVSGPFDLILANLRPPTLAAIAERLRKEMSAGGRLILSGFRPEEADGVIRHYAGVGFIPEEHHVEGGWAGVNLRRVDDSQ